MAKRSVQVTREVRWFETVEIDVPDDADETEANEVVDRALDLLAIGEPVEVPDGADWETAWEWEDQPAPFAAAKPMPWPPPEVAWVQVGEHRWATDGHAAVREDCGAVHGRAGRGWLTFGPDVGVLVDMCPATDRGLPGGYDFDPRMAPLLEAGDEVRRGVGASGEVPLAWVLRDGEVIAVVGAMWVRRG